jgi:malate dehydrogenase
MMRLDQNRAESQLALKAGVQVTDVTAVGIWGNHSSTQFPDFENAKIGSKPATEVITDSEWLAGEFISTVQQRGAAIIAARGASSAASAASAVIDSVRSVAFDTEAGDYASLAVVSHGEYGAPEGLIYGFPTRTESGSTKVVEGLSHSDFAKGLIAKTTEELVGEREAVKALLS